MSGLQGVLEVHKSLQSLDFRYLSWTLKSGAFKSLTRPDHFRYGPLQEKSSTLWQDTASFYGMSRR
jgi:hypothetical protein